MKASTLFAVTIAVLLGLAVVAGAKYSGLFNPKPPAPQTAKEPLKILVASRNLFENMTISSGDVHVRNAKPEEEAAYTASKDKYLPAMIQAGILRVLARNVEADQPIMKEYLQDNGLPNAINLRLSSPMMRAVNVSVPIERAAGGLIQMGERVDVFLTTRISTGSKNSDSITQTAAIARNLKVIVKRNMLWTALAPVKAGKPIDFTLEANAYRAALVEFARTKGELTLVPTAAPQEFAGRTKSYSVVPATQNDPTSKEYENEDERIAEFTGGRRTVSDTDLERIFNLKPIAQPRYVHVEKYTGVHYQGLQTFGATGRGPVRPVTSEESMGYQFQPVRHSKPQGQDQNEDSRGG